MDITYLFLATVHHIFHLMCYCLLPYTKLLLKIINLLTSFFLQLALHASRPPTSDPIPLLIPPYPQLQLFINFINSELPFYSPIFSGDRPQLVQTFRQAPWISLSPCRVDSATYHSQPTKHPVYSHTFTSTSICHPLCFLSLQKCLQSFLVSTSLR